jgi:glycosyltransferase involved in cell wall biosynthesis
MGVDACLVSVVVPAFNEEKRLPHCIHRVREAFGASPEIAAAYEIIVCDNNSTDETAAIAARSGCQVIFEPINQISRARNTGASVASGQWLLFIDADSWPSPELIKDIVPLLSDTSCIGCGSTIQVVGGPRWFKFVWESKNWSMRTFKWCAGGFVLCRRDAFLDIRGFSEEHYIFEELDFVRRLQTLAATRNQKFLVLHVHPFSTSGRRGIGKGFWWWAKFAFKLSFFHKTAVRDKDFARIWYEGDR